MHGWTRIGRRLVLVMLATSLGTSMALFTSCKQGENERCQIDSDCETDYVCYLANGNDPIVGGICRPTNATNTTVDLSSPPSPDMAAGPDMSATDM